MTTNVAKKLSDKISVDQIDVNGKRVLVRVDFNVPTKNGKVRDATRIEEAIPTINYLLDKGAQSVVLMSHLGRPDGQPNNTYTLRVVVPVLEQLLKRHVIFLPDCVGEQVGKTCQEPPKGTVILLENLRFHLEEEGSIKLSDGTKRRATPQQITDFRAALSRLGDVYVNDAFGTAHRAHSSMVGVQLPVRAAGFLLHKELAAFARAMDTPARPFVAIMGGAKVADKMPLIMNLLDKVDEMLIGGGMAYTFKKVKDGMKIGKSLYDKKGSELVPKILAKAAQRRVKLHFPVDFIAADQFAPQSAHETVTDAQGIRDEWMGMDIGCRTQMAFMQVVWRAKTVVFNGPMGVFEFRAYSSGTISLLQACAAATQMNGALTIVGGGDTTAAAKLFSVDNMISHASTGGGASLELLEGKALPGIMALSNKTEVAEDAKNKDAGSTTSGSSSSVIKARL